MNEIDSVDEDMEEEDGSGSDYHTEYHEITTTKALPKTTIKTTTTSATTTRLIIIKSICWMFSAAYIPSILMPDSKVFFV